jgi:hypothetical protein
MRKKQLKLKTGKSHSIATALHVSVPLLVYWLILFLDK